MSSSSGPPYHPGLCQIQVLLDCTDKPLKPCLKVLVANDVRATVKDHEVGVLDLRPERAIDVIATIPRQQIPVKIAEFKRNTNCMMKHSHFDIVTIKVWLTDW
ncbi:hypothetical protein N9S66_00740 [bacterium]|nr:hypothetical protein [bacterium]